MKDGQGNGNFRHSWMPLERDDMDAPAVHDGDGGGEQERQQSQDAHVHDKRPTENRKIGDVAKHVSKLSRSC